MRIIANLLMMLFIILLAQELYATEKNILMVDYSFSKGGHTICSGREPIKKDVTKQLCTYKKDSKPVVLSIIANLESDKTILISGMLEELNPDGNVKLIESFSIRTGMNLPGIVRNQIEGKDDSKLEVTPRSL